jgi:hypothetical protein
MKIGQKFSKLTLKEYQFYIDNHKNTPILTHSVYIALSLRMKNYRLQKSWH